LSGTNLTLSGKAGDDANNIRKRTSGKPLKNSSPMKRKTDIYHRWVAWSEEDQTYIARCPDLFHGGVHGDEPIKVAQILRSRISAVISAMN
jgi:hypothetical protein